MDGDLLELLDAIEGRSDDSTVRALDRLLHRAPRLTSLALRMGGRLLSRFDNDGLASASPYLGGLSPEYARRFAAALHAMAEAMGESP